MEATKPTKQQINAAALEVIARISEGMERERLEREVNQDVEPTDDFQYGLSMWSARMFAFSFYPSFVGCFSSNARHIATFRLKSRKTV
jgi:hypothetical protein